MGGGGVVGAVVVAGGGGCRRSSGGGSSSGSTWRLCNILCGSSEIIKVAKVFLFDTLEFNC